MRSLKTDASSCHTRRRTTSAFQKPTSRASRARDVFMTNMRSTIPFVKSNDSSAISNGASGWQHELCLQYYLFYWWRNKALKRLGPQKKKKAICKFSWKTVLDFTDSVLPTTCAHLGDGITWGAVVLKSSENSTTHCFCVWKEGLGCLIRFPTSH